MTWYRQLSGELWLFIISASISWYISHVSRKRVCFRSMDKSSTTLLPSFHISLSVSFKLNLSCGAHINIQVSTSNRKRTQSIFFLGLLLEHRHLWWKCFLFLLDSLVAKINNMNICEHAKMMMYLFFGFLHACWWDHNAYGWLQHRRTVNPTFYFDFIGSFSTKMARAFFHMSQWNTLYYLFKALSLSTAS